MIQQKKLQNLCPIYQQNLKPLVRQAVNTAASAAKSFAPQLGTAIDMGVNEIGKQTGAFGLKRKKRTKTQRNEMLKGKGLYLS